jgi:transcriptional regulator with XRE-family HTH domain
LGALPKPISEERRAIARRLRAALGSAGLGQNELGREFGKGSSAMSGWMSGRTQPSLEELARICALLDVSADEILGLKPVPEPAYPPELLERVMRDAQNLEAAAKLLSKTVSQRRRKR